MYVTPVVFGELLLDRLKKTSTQNSLLSKITDRNYTVYTKGWGTLGVNPKTTYTHISLSCPGDIRTLQITLKHRGVLLIFPCDKLILIFLYISCKLIKGRIGLSVLLTL